MEEEPQKKKKRKAIQVDLLQTFRRLRWSYKITLGCIVGEFVVDCVDVLACLLSVLRMDALFTLSPFSPSPPDMVLLCGQRTPFQICLGVDPRSHQTEAGASFKGMR